MYACSVDVARFLVEHGAEIDAKDNNNRSVLMGMIEEGEREEIALWLIQNGAKMEEEDYEGRNALISAVWKNRVTVIEANIEKSPDKHKMVNHADKRKRRALHHLALDRSRASQPDEQTDLRIFELLHEHGADIEAQNSGLRTCFCWALRAGNNALAWHLLGKDQNMAKQVTAHGLNMLQHACMSERIDVRVVEELINLDLKVNVTTHRSDKNLLHLAAEAGNIPVVKLLLKEQVNPFQVDAYGNTPFFCATSDNPAIVKEICELLAPWKTFDPLSDLDQRSEASKSRAEKTYRTQARARQRVTVDNEAARSERRTMLEVMKAAKLGAAQLYDATVVDFQTKVHDAAGAEHNFAIKDYNIQDLLYEPRKNSKRLSTVKTKDFRWIHLPANNMTWCRDLIAKLYIDKKLEAIAGFKKLEQSLHHEHRGAVEHLHSTYMDPTCQSSEMSEFRMSAIKRYNTVDSGAEHSPNVGHKDGESAFSGLRLTGLSVDTKKTTADADINQSAHNRAVHQQHSPVNHMFMFMFMPYLHFESYHGLLEMKDLLNHICPSGKAYKRYFPTTPPQELESKNPKCSALFKAHLKPLQRSMHIRRTLDQYFYHNIDTRTRDGDQVIHRAQRRADKEKRDIEKRRAGGQRRASVQRRISDLMRVRDQKRVGKEERAEDSEAEYQVIMVDQLWLFIVDNDTLITCFPQAWNVRDQQYAAVDMLDGIKEVLYTTDPILNMDDLAIMITSLFYGTHKSQGYRRDDLQVLEQFASEVGHAMNEEVELFKEFNQHVCDRKSTPNINDVRDEKYKEALRSIKRETQLLKTVKDLLDELNILRVLFNKQIDILRSFDLAHPGRRDTPDTKGKSGKVFQDHEYLIKEPLAAVEAMHEQTKRTYSSLRDLLDLKQKHANALEAWYAGKQAYDAGIQGNVIFVFTTVTVGLLPLSFIASVFAIPITEFSSRPGGLKMDHVFSYVFGVGGGFAFIFIVIAALAGSIPRKLQRWKNRRAKRRHDSSVDADEPKINDQIEMVPLSRSSHLSLSLREQGMLIKNRFIRPSQREDVEAQSSRIGTGLDD